MTRAARVCEHYAGSFAFTICRMYSHLQVLKTCRCEDRVIGVQNRGTLRLWMTWGSFVATR